MPYLSGGNRRMNIPTFSLPSGITCPNSTIYCNRWCYAKKSERLYPAVKPSRIRNLNDSKRNTFISEMVNEINKKNTVFIRIHESGDFYSQEYLEKWFKICKEFPNKKFLAYTQCYNLDYTNKPDNLILYWTVWPDSRNIPKDGLKAFVVDNGSGVLEKYFIDNKLDGKTFKCKKGKGSDLVCNKCLYCFEGKGDVIFKVH